MSIIVERIAEVIEFQSISVRAFEQRIGASNGMIGRAISKNTDISASWLSKIIETFPSVNPTWLLSGVGEKFIKENECPKRVQNLNAQKPYLNAHYERPIPEIERGVQRIDSELLAGASAQGIPLIPIDAAAGFLSGVGTQVMDYECERYQIPGFKGAEFLIRISGDSMTPKYESGDIVACQSLQHDTFLQWNKVYVVDSEQGVLIKRIKPGRAEDTLTLVSDNAEYAPFEIERRQVYGLGRVVGLIRIE